MSKYIVKSIGYNVLGNELDQELCQYEDTIRWAQPSFERAWSTIEFSSELEALTQLQKICDPDRKLTVLEDTGKVVSTWGHESGLTSMRIVKVRSENE